MRHIILMFTICLPHFATAQNLVDSTSERFHNARLLSNSQVYILGLSGPKTKSRFSIDDKHHNILIERANRRSNLTFHLDSVCNFLQYPINCNYEDSVQSNYLNKEKLNWGNSTRIFDFKMKKQQIDRKDLLVKWFGNLDSISACREVFINDDAKPDLAIVRKIQGTEVIIDSLTKKYSWIPNGKIEFQLQTLINRDTCYSIIKMDNLGELKYLYLANFKVIDERSLYFFIDEARRSNDGVESLIISEYKVD